MTKNLIAKCLSSGAWCIGYRKMIQKFFEIVRVEKTMHGHFFRWNFNKHKWSISKSPAYFRRLYQAIIESWRQIVNFFKFHRRFQRIFFQLHVKHIKNPKKLQRAKCNHQAIPKTSKRFQQTCSNNLMRFRAVYLIPAFIYFNFFSLQFLWLA